MRVLLCCNHLSWDNLHCTLIGNLISSRNSEYLSNLYMNRFIQEKIGCETEY